MLSRTEASGIGDWRRLERVFVKEAERDEDDDTGWCRRPANPAGATKADAGLSRRASIATKVVGEMGAIALVRCWYWYWYWYLVSSCRGWG